MVFNYLTISMLDLPPLSKRPPVPLYDVPEIHHLPPYQGVFQKITVSTYRLCSAST